MVWFSFTKLSVNAFFFEFVDAAGYVGNHCWAAFLSITLTSHSALQTVYRLIDERRLSRLNKDLLPVLYCFWNLNGRRKATLWFFALGGVDRDIAAVSFMRS